MSVYTPDVPVITDASSGLLDIRLVVSRDGVSFNYTGATNPRAPFVPLGVNRCGGDAHAPGVKGGWCSPTSGVEAHTSFDTSAMYMVSRVWQGCLASYLDKTLTRVRKRCLRRPSFSLYSV